MTHGMSQSLLILQENQTGLLYLRHQVLIKIGKQETEHNNSTNKLFPQLEFAVHQLLCTRPAIRQLENSANMNETSLFPKGTYYKKRTGI